MASANPWDNYNQSFTRECNDSEYERDMSYRMEKLSLKTWNEYPKPPFYISSLQEKYLTIFNNVNETKYKIKVTNKTILMGSGE